MRIRRLPFWSAVAVALLACGEVRDRRPELNFASGERLRARVLDGGDGAIVFLGWHDTELGVDCVFRRMEGGELRCLPYPPLGSIVYRDADCTDAAIAVPPATTAPGGAFAYVYDVPANAVCGNMTVRQIAYAGDAQTADGSLYEISTSGECQRSSKTNLFDVFAIGDAMSEAAYVEATVVDEAVSDTLSARRIVASDGAWLIDDIEDVESGAPCAAALLEEGVCVPALAGQLMGGYADAACTEATAAATVPRFFDRPDLECDWQPRYVVEFRDVCGIRKSIHLVGESVEAAYSKNPEGTCVTDPPTAGFYFGDEVPMTDFVPLHWTEIGKGRLRAEYVGSKERPLLSNGTLVDSETGEACFPLPMCDGTRRCVPATEGSLVYADPECRTPALLVSPSCKEPTPKRAIVPRTSDIGCATPEYYALGKELTGTPYRKEGSRCVPTVATADGVTLREARRLSQSDLPKFDQYVE